MLENELTGGVGSIMSWRVVRIFGILVISLSLFAVTGLRTNAAQRLYFSDSELKQGFVLSVFGSEFNQSDEADLRVRKFNKPILFYIDNESGEKPTEVVKFINSLRHMVPTLRYTLTPDPAAANYRVHLLDPENLSQHYLERRQHLTGQLITSQNESNIQCFGEAGVNQNSEILFVDVFIPMYDDFKERRSCIVEEIMQGMGPMNDSSLLPYSIFNDANNDVIYDVTIFDLYIMNMLYHPAIRPGMQRKQVMPILSSVLPVVKKIVK